MNPNLIRAARLAGYRPIPFQPVSVAEVDRLREQNKRDKQLTASNKDKRYQKMRARMALSPKLLVRKRTVQEEPCSK